MKITLLLFLFLSFLFYSCIAKEYSVIKSGDGNFYLTDGISPQALAHGE